MRLEILGVLTLIFIASVAEAILPCDRALIAQSQTNVRDFFKLADFEPSEDDGSGGDRVYRKTSGRPDSARVVVPGETVYRHYISDVDQDPEAIRRTIVMTRRLRAGRTPYVTGDLPWFRMTYPDVRGIFVTTPEWTSEKVGIFKNLPYVDFRFEAGTGLVELEPGILLVPGPLETEIPIRPL